MVRKIPDINPDDLVERYLAGESELSLSRYFGVSRTPIRRLLIEAGLQPRNRQQGMVTRMARTSAAERQRLTEAAHVARRGQTDRPDSVAKRMTARALSNARKDWQVGSGEAILGTWLHKRGLTPIPQYPVDTYNIDLAITPVAVEVTVNTRQPMGNPLLLQRAEHLGKRGWHVIYVWITQAHFLNEGAADQIVALYQSAERDPSTSRRYWVIRGSGELASSGRLYGNQ